MKKLKMTRIEQKMFRILLKQIDAGRERGVRLTNEERDLLITQMVYICHRYFSDENYAIYWHKNIYYKAIRERVSNTYRFTALKAWTFEREYDPMWFFEDTMCVSGN